jgi:TNF receptor-associated protein 1
MSKDDLIANLGVIARSGSKAFLEQLKSKDLTSDSSSNIIGQFGVGFYSVFMVADKVDVFTRSSTEDQGYKWSSDGTGSYEIHEAEGVECGTKIVLHLKTDCREFCDDSTVENVINKYSNFIGSPIYLNGKKANIVKPVWLSDPKTVTVQQHNEFYRFISGSYDVPRYILHYNTDVPLSIHALLYFPEGKPGLFEMSREVESGVALYTRKVLIKNKTDNILPKWLRFVKGVVDSEDIPLNLSRELLQNSALIRKLRDVLSSKVVKFLQDQLKKKPEEYEKFYNDYGLFIKEGIITNPIQSEKVRSIKNLTSRLIYITVILTIVIVTRHYFILFFVVSRRVFGTLRKDILALQVSIFQIAHPESSRTSVRDQSRFHSINETLQSESELRNVTH